MVTLVSTTSSEELPDGDVSGATISGDGNYAAFLSNSANLPGYTGAQQVYVKNLLTGTLTLASADANGTPGARISPNNAGGSTNASLSNNGSLVLLRSTSPNFGSAPAIYIKSLVDGTLTDVSADAAYASDPSMSTDGTAVAYDGFGTNGLNGIFVSKGGHSTPCVHRRGRHARQWLQLEPEAFGRWQVHPFQSTATNLGPSDPAINGTNIETFVKDLVTGTVTLVFPKIGSETYSNPPSNGQVFSGDDRRPCSRQVKVTSPPATRTIRSTPLLSACHHRRTFRHRRPRRPLQEAVERRPAVTALVRASRLRSSRTHRPTTVRPRNPSRH